MHPFIHSLMHFLHQLFIISTILPSMNGKKKEEETRTVHRETGAAAHVGGFSPIEPQPSVLVPCSSKLFTERAVPIGLMAFGNDIALLSARLRSLWLYSRLFWSDFRARFYSNQP